MLIALAKFHVNRLSVSRVIAETARRGRGRDRGHIAHATQAARHNYRRKTRNENRNINELFGKTNATGVRNGNGNGSGTRVRSRPRGCRAAGARGIQN